LAFEVQLQVDSIVASLQVHASNAFINQSI